jgi:ketosteroid isomerase-like protein
MAHANEQVIQKFYSSFQNKDYRGMQACYADDVIFTDDVFVGLKGNRAKAMWHMLSLGAKNFTLTFDNVQANDTIGSCHWTASYTFSLTGNKVVNDINAVFEFKDGKIVRHTDSFDFYRWARQAVGFKGWLLGWTSFFRNKIREGTGKKLDEFIEKNPEYK